MGTGTGGCFSPLQVRIPINCLEVSDSTLTVISRDIAQTVGDEMHHATSYLHEQKENLNRLRVTYNPNCFAKPLGNVAANPDVIRWFSQNARLILLILITPK